MGMQSLTKVVLYSFSSTASASFLVTRLVSILDELGASVNVGPIYHLTLVSRANLSPISKSTTPFRVSFKFSNSLTPFVIVSTFEPS